MRRERRERKQHENVNKRYYYTRKTNERRKEDYT
jgi:hypothetical protein